MTISQAVYEAQIEQIADLQARLAKAEALLRESVNVTMHWDGIADRIDAFLRPACPRPFKEDDGSVADCVGKGHCSCVERYGLLDVVRRA